MKSTVKEKIIKIAALAAAVVLLSASLLTACADRHDDDGRPISPGAGSVATDGGNGRTDTGDTQTKGDEGDVQATDGMGIGSYIRYLVNYIHGPYKLGDDFPSEAVVGLLFLFCNSNADDLDYVRLYEDKGELWVRGEGLRACGKALLGDKFDPDVYLTLDAIKDKAGFYGTVYSEETDVYKFLTGTDYWGGDPYYIENGTAPEIKTTADGATVTVSVNRVASIGADPEDPFTLEYSFEKITEGGFIYYRLTEVKAAE